MGAKSAASTKRRRRTGRPNKNVSPDQLQKIVAALRTAVPIADAAWLGDVSPRSCYRWLAEGEKDDQLSRDTPERSFWRTISRAIAEGRALLSSRAFSQSRWDGNLALKILERRDAKNWGLKQEVEVKDVTPPASPRGRLAARMTEIETRMDRAQRAGLEHRPDEPLPGPEVPPAPGGDR